MSEPVEKWEGCETFTIEDLVRFCEPDYESGHTFEPAYEFGNVTFYQKKNPYDDNEPMRKRPSGCGQGASGWDYE